MSADVLLFICKTVLFYYMVYFISIFKFLQGYFCLLSYYPENFSIHDRRLSAV